MWTHRWWLAAVASLLTPWPGPHIDRYLPVGWLLLQATDESADAGFWLLAAAVLAIAYAVWLLLLSALAACLSRHRD